MGNKLKKIIPHEKMPCGCKKDNVLGCDYFTKFPQYANFKTRLQTFYFPFQWPPSITPGPRNLAESGFFYEGISDIVVCFTCGGKLHSWHAEDSAYNEHAQWFPNCSFIKNLNKDVLN